MDLARLGLRLQITMYAANVNPGTDQMTRGLEDTVLSADGVGRLLNIFLLANAATEIELGLLSFRQGNLDASVVNAAACLTMESDVGSNAIVRIDRNAFRLCNRDAGTGSAVVVRARDADVYFRGNLLLDNDNVAGAVFCSGWVVPRFMSVTTAWPITRNLVPVAGQAACKLPGRLAIYSGLAITSCGTTALAPALICR